MTDTLFQSAKSNSSLNDIIRYQKFAHSIVLLSQGLPFLFAGEEILRSKKMIRNTYNLSDNINAIDWNNKVLHQDLFDYFRKFIALRKKYPHFHLGDAENIRKNLSFKDVPSALSEKVIIYQITNPNKRNDNMLVILNASDDALKIEFSSDKVKVLLNNFNFDDNATKNEVIIEKTSVSLFLFEDDNLNFFRVN
jgi:pullulanase